jgi:hypothetical protein
VRYGVGFYRYGMWFGFGQVRFRRWVVDICLFKRADGYNKLWLTLSLHGCGVSYVGEG